jgi:hypothetical protein
MVPDTLSAQGGQKKEAEAEAEAHRRLHQTHQYVEHIYIVWAQSELSDCSLNMLRRLLATACFFQ